MIGNQALIRLRDDTGQWRGLHDRGDFTQADFMEMLGYVQFVAAFDADPTYGQYNRKKAPAQGGRKL